MAFQATIDNAESKSLWCKCISSLNAFQNEHIKFILTRSKLTISTLNSAHTSHGEIQFDKSFFKNYQFNSDYLDPTDEGFSNDTKNGSKGISYTFAIRSRLISMIFKKNEDLEVESFKLQLHGQKKTSSDNYEDENTNDDFIGNFRLHIEIKTKSMIRKEYNIYYIPCKNDVLKIASLYKESFENLQKKKFNNEDNNDDDEINYLMVNNNILKNFLDNISSNTEDFTIYVNKKEFSLTAFTKGIFVKEKEILKQPMSVNISFSTEELLDLKLYEESNGLILDKKITFRLKDFKNFLGLSLNNEYCEIWFKRPGEPILFEIIKNSVMIQFVQITDSETGHYTNNIEKKLIKNVSKISQAVHINNKEKEYSNSISVETETNSEPLFVPDDENSQPQYQNNDDNNDDNSSPQNEDDEDNQDDYNYMGSFNEPTVTWHDNDQQKLNKLMQNNEKSVIREAKAKSIKQIKKRKLNNNLNEDSEEFGPTQDIEKVTSIFD